MNKMKAEITTEYYASYKTGIQNGYKDILEKQNPKKKQKWLSKNSWDQKKNVNTVTQITAKK